MLEFLEFSDIGFWIKFGVVSFLIVILPVWIFNFVDISFLWKMGYTLAGFLGVWLALSGKSIGRKH